MKSLATDSRVPNDGSIWLQVERDFNISVRDDIKEFLSLNSGGHPTRDIIIVNGEEYEVRVFLSLDSQNKYYFIERPLVTFLRNTKGKIIPIGIDSGDNYYCVNNETGAVYYWSMSQDEYYRISDNLDTFCKLFEVQQ